MLSSLSIKQRAAIMLGLIASGPACVAIGASNGWSAGSLIAASAGFGTLAGAAFVASLGVLKRFTSDLTLHANRLAQGDLSGEIDTSGNGNPDAAATLRALASLQAELRRSIGAIRTGADSVTNAAREIALGNADLSQRTEQTASNLQQAASSMSQLNGTVRQSADAAAQANQLASSATQVARRGGEVVSQVVSTMSEINASSKKIADIIGVIDGIAFQTNILALNAAVEAARAGEQGRGFAVVAGEVRSLAGRSAEAAREIKSLIGTSVDKVEAGTRLVEDAGSTMGEIVASVQRVTDIIGEISAAASEQSLGLGQVNGSVVQLDQMTQQNASLVEQSAAAAESLKEQAARLAGVVANFRLGGETAAPRPAVAAPPMTSVAPVAKPAARPAVKGAAKPALKTAARPLAAKPVPTAAPAAAPVRPAAPAPAAASADNGDWETF